MALAILAEAKGLSNRQADRRAMEEFTRHDELIEECVAHLTQGGPAPKQKCVVIETAGPITENVRPGMEGKMMNMKIPQSDIWEFKHPIRSITLLGGMTAEEAYPILRGWQAGCTLVPEGQAAEFLETMAAAK